MPSLSGAFDLLLRPIGMDTDPLPKDHRPITTGASAERTVTAHAGATTARPRAGGPVMTLGVFQAMKGQRNVEDLLRAIPNALRPLLVFDRLTLSLDRGVNGEPRRYVVQEAARPDLTTQGLQSACAAPLTAPQRTLGTLEIASRHP